MKINKKVCLLLILSLVAGVIFSSAFAQKGWTNLFDGKTLKQ